MGFADPFPQNPNTTYDSLHQGEALYFQDANPFDPGSGCEIDGLPTDCSRLARQLENGTVGIQYGAGGKIYNVSNFSGFSGGMWVSVPTPSDPEYDKSLPLGRLKVTDNAYKDVWVPFSSSFSSRVAQQSPGIMTVGFRSTGENTSKNGCGSGAVEVIIWDGSFAHLNSVAGHMTYVIDGANYSWERNSQWNISPSKDYIDANRQYRNGTGFVLDFGDYNEAFATAIKNGYGSPASGYNLLTNNCGDAFCRVTKAWGIKNRVTRDGRLSSLDGPPILDADSCITPACHEAYIREHLKAYTCQVNHYVW